MADANHRYLVNGQAFYNVVDGDVRGPANKKSTPLLDQLAYELYQRKCLASLPRLEMTDIVREISKLTPGGP